MLSLFESILTLCVTSLVNSDKFYKIYIHSLTN